MFVTISFWALAYGAAVAFTESAADPATDVIAQAGAGFGLSLLMVPAVFAAAAFASSRQDAPIMVLAGMGLAVAVGLPLLALPNPNPIAALISGYAAGAVVTVSRPEGMPLRNRVIAAVVVTVVVHLGLLALPAPTAWIAPALPFTAMGIADGLTRPVVGKDGEPQEASP